MVPGGAPLPEANESELALLAQLIALPPVPHP